MLASPLRLTALIAVLLLIGWLGWHSRTREPGLNPALATIPAENTPPTPSPSGPPITGSVDALDPETRALLATIESLLHAAGMRPGEAVLTFKDDNALAQFVSRAAKAGLRVIAASGPLRSVRVGFDNLRSLQNELLGHAGDYDAISGNAVIHVPRVPTREERPDIDHLPFGAETLRFLGVAGDTSAWGRGVTIAILDTGVASDATFGNGRLRAIDIGHGAAPGRGSDDGHGTAVAALAAGLSADAAGVAPAANLLSIRVTDTTGVSDVFTVANAIVAAVDSGARVINISLGGQATGPVLNSAIEYASSRGAVIVAAAGNEQSSALAWPAADPRVISVGAVDRSEQQVTFSNSGDQLRLAAPGYGVQSAWLSGQRVTFDGTSASAPLVSGAIAAVVSQNPQLSPRQAADLLMKTASDVGVPGPDRAYGSGILNLGWAMNSNNPTYVDTAVSTYRYDPATQQVQLLVQNRSTQAVSGLTLTVNAAGISASLSVPSLTPGETFLARVPIDTAPLRSTGAMPFSTILVNPPGLLDRVPANNRRTSVITTPPAPK